MPDFFIETTGELVQSPPVMDDVMYIPIVGEIGGWGFNLPMLMQMLQNWSGKEIKVPINTYGGDLFEGFALHNALLGREEFVTTSVIGYTFSMGSILLMAGDKRTMPEEGYIMIHDPYIAWAEGGSEELANVSDLLNMVRNNMADLYARETKLKRDQALEMMAKETWLDAGEAKRLGFVNELTKGTKIQAKFSEEQLGLYKNIPADLIPNKTYPVMSKLTDLKGLLQNAISLLETKPQNTAVTPQPSDGKDGDDPNANNDGADANADGDGNEPIADEGNKAQGVVLQEEDLAVLRQMGELLPTLTERLTQLETETASLAASQKKANGQIANLVNRGAQVDQGNSDAPSATEAVKLFNQRRTKMRPGNDTSKTKK